MKRNILFLNGIAVLAVVLNHAAGWSQIAMFWWTDRYRQVSVPNFDAINSPGYFLIIFLGTVTIFCVPFFLYMTGYFLAYASLSNKTSSWNVVLDRTKWILIPYLVWSCLVFFYQGIFGNIYPFPEYIRRIFLGEALPQYYYVIMILQVYLLSPWIIQLVRWNWKISLVAAVALQLGTQAIRYFSIFSHLNFPVPAILFTNFIFYFTLGSVTFFNNKKISSQVIKIGWWLLAGTVIFLVSAIVEPEIIFQKMNVDLRGGPNTLSSMLFCAFFLLTCIAFDDRIKFNSPLLKTIGQWAFGIYLAHALIMEILARLVYHFIPGLLGNTLGFLMFIATISLTIPLVFALIVRRYNQKILRIAYG